MKREWVEVNCEINFKIIQMVQFELTNHYFTNNHPSKIQPRRQQCLL